MAELLAHIMTLKRVKAYLEGFGIECAIQPITQGYPETAVRFIRFNKSVYVTTMAEARNVLAQNPFSQQD